ncbi:MAG: stringent starvation protein B [Gammaproteobacteria bacterium]
MKPAEDLSLRPHLLRAIYEWCAEQKYTPYLTAAARRGDVRVPPAAIVEDAVIFNISQAAVRDLHIGDSVSFTARFRGATSRVFLPAAAITGIYARETGSGMAFAAVAESAAAPPEDKPTLRIV